MEDIIIELRNVSMRYNLNLEKVDSLKEYIIKYLTRRLFFGEFWAVKDVSFAVERGEILGIVGLNGAGKSTILKIIAGVLKPTRGAVKINGRVAPLIELGAGFDFDLTARENIFLNGAILGHSKKFMSQKFEEIVEFSELQQFLDVAIKNYSSGMIARLGFAVATIVNPDILIVDEILAVGDFQFKKKCMNRIEEMLNLNTTVIMVSHTIEQIEKMCKRALWLENGYIKMLGDTKEVCREYKNS